MPMSKPKSARLQESLRQPGRLQMSFLLAIMGLIPPGLAIIGESAALNTGGILTLAAVLLGFTEWLRILCADKRDQQNAVSKN